MFPVTCLFRITMKAHSRLRWLMLQNLQVLESTSGKFASIELKGFLAGALSKVSKSLINNSSFDIVPFVINEMAESVARWIEKELLNGTKDKIDGLSKVTTLTAAAQAAVTADELIDAQEEIPDVYQADAIWIMSKKTRTAIRKLKDSDGNYILNKDADKPAGDIHFSERRIYVREYAGYGGRKTCHSLWRHERTGS